MNFDFLIKDSIGPKRPKQLFSKRKLIEEHLLITAKLLNINLNKINLLLPEGEILNRTEFDENAFFVNYEKVGLEGLSSFDWYLPFAIQSTLYPIQADLIPQPLWNVSLANLLTQKSWNLIRNRMFAETGNRCVICGSDAKDCHEVWEYFIDEDELSGIAKLKLILALCHSCHMMFHTGFVEDKEREGNPNFSLNNTLQRLKIVNRWSDTEIIQYHEWSVNLWSFRSKYRSLKWAVDLSVLTESESLRILSNKTNKKGWSLLIDYDDLGVADYILQKSFGSIEVFILGKEFSIDGIDCFNQIDAEVYESYI